MRKIAFFCFLLWWMGGNRVSAQVVSDEQYVYTIHLGTFPEVLPQDFASLRTLGFVYSQPIGRMVDVFMGGWNDEAAARKLIPTLQNMGFNASVRKLPVTQGKPVRVIQLEARRSTAPIAWEKYFVAESLHVLIANDIVKILSGPYESEAALNADLQRFRASGFPKAFPKTVNSAMLHEVTGFETGGVKRPAFRIDLAHPKRIASEAEPVTYDQPESVRLASKGGAHAVTPQEQGNAIIPQPEVRSNVRRSSARHLQEILKTLGYLSSGIDGYYGNMTAAAFAKAWAEHRQVNKYKVLANSPLFSQKTQSVILPLQRAIDELMSEPEAALSVLATATRPEAKAWRAYYLFMRQGPSPQVDQLMNEAIRAAFVDADPKRFPMFDFRARYTYPDLEQLLRHLFYVQVAAPKDPLGLPCWLFQRHGKLMNQILSEPVAQRNKWILSPCSDTYDWEYIRVLRVVMEDMSAGQEPSWQEVQGAESRWLQLMWLPQLIDVEEAQKAVAWAERLQQSVSGWKLRDPLLAHIGVAWQLAWFQSFILLEDYFMDQGFKPTEARALAAATLQALAQPWMKRFI